MLHHFYRKIDDIHYEMICTFGKFNLEFLIQSRIVLYKYVIINSPRIVEKDDCFEYLHAHSKDYGDVDRCLRLSTEEIHCIHRMCEWDCEIVNGLGGRDFFIFQMLVGMHSRYLEALSLVHSARIHSAAGFHPEISVWGGSFTHCVPPPPLPLTFILCFGVSLRYYIFL